MIFQVFAGEGDGTIDQATLTTGYKDLDKSEDRTLACVMIKFQILTHSYRAIDFSNGV